LRKSAWIPVSEQPSILMVCEKYYNRNVHDRTFVVGDLVLRIKQKKQGQHKLSSWWEGPFKIKAVTRPGSYRLCTLDDADIDNSWHIDLLRRFYP